MPGRPRRGGARVRRLPSAGAGLQALAVLVVADFLLVGVALGGLHALVGLHVALLDAFLVLRRLRGRLTGERDTPDGQAGGPATGKVLSHPNRSSLLTATRIYKARRAVLQISAHRIRRYG